MDEDKIQQRRRDQEEQATQQRAAILGRAYFDMRGYITNAPLFKDILPDSEMMQNHILPLSSGDNDNNWQFGITTQTPQSYITNLAENYKNNGKNIQFILISDSSLREMMNRYNPPAQVVYDDIKIAKIGDSDTIKQVSETLNTVKSDDIFDYLIDQANRLQASDIHIENQRDHIRIRMRIDGVLHPVADLDTDRYRALLGALASKANISTAATESQSGHIQREVEHEGQKRLLNLRVETIPTLYGQDAVMRLFNFDQNILNLDNLSIEANDRKQIDEIISHPRGMVLMVGPTGSGKSTTLYSMINALNSSTRKIITLEDPVECSIEGVSQIPIDTTKDQNFTDALRAVLRLDPDIVMVGEIRDADTAKTAIQASITGHLVLSTFHANSTAAAFSRMIDLIGVNPIFSSAVRLIIAQRLLRRLDDSTKEQYDPDDAMKRWVQNALKDLPEGVEKPDLDNFKLWRPVPNSESPFGYKGRLVIMEQMVVTEEIQRFLRGDEADMHSEVIEKTARRNGMVTLLERAVLAALRGETTLEEVNRTI